MNSQIPEIERARLNRARKRLHIDLRHAEFVRLNYDERAGKKLAFKAWAKLFRSSRYLRELREMAREENGYKANNCDEA